MKARFSMRKRVLSSREPYGTMHEVRRGPSYHLPQSGNTESPFDVGAGETETAWYRSGHGGLLESALFCNRGFGFE